jgi:hypothetical protein
MEDANASKEKSRKVKERIVDSMKKGTLSNEPEVELLLRSKEDQQLPKERKRLADEDVVPSSKEGKRNKVQKASKSNLEDDDFFAATGDD